MLALLHQHYQALHRSQTDEGAGESQGPGGVCKSRCGEVGRHVYPRAVACEDEEEGAVGVVREVQFKACAGRAGRGFPRLFYSGLDVVESGLVDGQLITVAGTSPVIPFLCSLRLFHSSCHIHSCPYYDTCTMCRTHSASYSKHSVPLHDTYTQCINTKHNTYLVTQQSI